MCLIEISQGHLVYSAVETKKPWAWWFNNFLSQNPIAAKQIKGGWQGDRAVEDVRVMWFHPTFYGLCGQREMNSIIKVSALSMWQSLNVWTRMVIIYHSKTSCSPCFVILCVEGATYVLSAANQYFRFKLQYAFSRGKILDTAPYCRIKCWSVVASLNTNADNFSYLAFV